MTEQNPYDSPASHADERRDRNTKIIGVVSTAVAVVFVVLLVLAGASFLLVNKPMEVPNAQTGPIVETSAPVPTEQEAPNSPEPELPPSTESDSTVTR